jgi:mutator protein MutT
MYNRAMDKSGIFHAAVAAVILNDQNEVLLTQRSLQRDHHPGEWEITAGRLNQGESFEQALIREAEEELSISLKIIAPLDTFHFFRGPEKIEHIGVTYVCKISEGIPVVDGIEEVAWKWVPLQNANNIVTDENIRQALSEAYEYIENQKSTSK